MKKINLLHVVGARPNFMKAAPLIAALQRYPRFSQTLIHTGQHYDARMSDIFFADLGMPNPDDNLGVGQGLPAEQVAQVMLRLQDVIQRRKPDWFLVYGDVNSTLAAALSAVKNGIKVAHIEAGLRSRDRSMPEEINRILTDQIADILFTPSKDATANLIAEGISKNKIYFCGNIMIDSLNRFLPKAGKPFFLNQSDKYILVTLHRPSNVDDPRRLKILLRALTEVSKEALVVFPVHPRTKKMISELGFSKKPNKRLLFLEPLGYLDFLGLEKHAAGIITDSGGVQEESTCLGIPCLTLRENTERPTTLTHGTNRLIGSNVGRLKDEVVRIIRGRGKKGVIPPLWDGKTAQRIAAYLDAKLRAH